MSVILSQRNVKVVDGHKPSLVQFGPSCDVWREMEHSQLYLKQICREEINLKQKSLNVIG